MSNSDQGRYNLDKLAVLVIDDSQFMRYLIESILRALRIGNVFQSADAAEGFTKLGHNAIDLVLVDWVMEPLDGLDFTRLIRTGSDSPNAYIPLIMVTGHTEVRRVKHARDVGVNEFLAKPLSAKELYQKIVSVIDHPRPFIRTKTFFGPDRRRKNVGPPRNSAERRTEAEAA